MDDLIKKLIDLLEDVKWGIGASKLLSYHGITDRVNDLDILVAREDYNKAYQVFKALGRELKVEKRDLYRTEAFSSFHVDGIDIDLMSEFTIKHQKGLYTFPLDSIHFIDQVPLTSLENWYIAYLLTEPIN